MKLASSAKIGVLAHFYRLLFGHSVTKVQLSRDCIVTCKSLPRDFCVIVIVVISRDRRNSLKVTDNFLAVVLYLSVGYPLIGFKREHRSSHPGDLYSKLKGGFPVIAEMTPSECSPGRRAISSHRMDMNQLLHQYHEILAACNIQGKRACEFSFNIAQSQYFVILMQELFYRMAKKAFVALHDDSVARQNFFVAQSVASYCDVSSYV